MKKSIVFILLSALFSAKSYQQTITVNQPTVHSNVDFNMQNASTGDDEAKQQPVNCNGKRIYLTKGGDNGIYIQGTTFSYNAGDTLVLKASQNPYSYVTLDYFTKGTAACPVVVTNEGGQVILTNYNGGAIPGGFELFGTQFMKITGTGSSDKYGFKVTTPDNRGVGVNIYGRSSNINVDHVNIYNKGAGFWVKQEASCDTTLQFPHWVIHNIRIHDNFIHNCQQEGMYLGSTDPNGSRVIVCNGQSITPLPLRLGNIHVYNNILDSCGRGAIQLSSADSGNNEIYNNTITRIGYEYNIYQGNGIVLGGYTHASVFNNSVDSTYSTGIYTLGAGYVQIFNNIINHSGMLDGSVANGMASIMVDTRNTTNPTPGKVNPVPLTFHITNNRCGANTDMDVRVYNTYLTFNTDNVICNNTSISGRGAANYAVPSNIRFTSSCSSKPNSNTSNVSDAAITAIKTSVASVYPNPASYILNVNLNSMPAGKVQFNIYDAQGRLIKTSTQDQYSSSQQSSVNVQSLTPGLYSLEILSGNNKITTKIYKIIKPVFAAN